jgi:hypothetical protein
MKKIFLSCAFLLCATLISSCTTNDAKEISGTLIFDDVGTHVFNINADHIEATITLAGPNFGDTQVYENVQLYRSSDYNVKIGTRSTGTYKSEFLNNLVVMYEVEAGSTDDRSLQEIADAGYIKIDWKGLN